MSDNGIHEHEHHDRDVSHGADRDAAKLSHHNDHDDHRRLHDLWNDDRFDGLDFDIIELNIIYYVVDSRNEHHVIYFNHDIEDHDRRDDV